MTAATPILELDRVHRVYPGTPPVRPVRGVSLTITRGELVAVVGPSGSGKTTLLHLMAALDRPTSGGGSDRRPGDRDAGRAPPGRAAGASARGRLPAVLPARTAQRGRQRGHRLLYRGVPAADRRRLARQALECVGFGHRLGQRPTTLSGGERQRVAIARALVGPPEVVLADEPTGNLDTATSAHLVALLQRLNREGTTLVVVTHDHGVAAAMGRRVELRDGQVVDDSGQRPP